MSRIKFNGGDVTLPADWRLGIWKQPDGTYRVFAMTMHGREDLSQALGRLAFDTSTSRPAAKMALSGRTP